VKISILASDLSDNSTGRADLLARLLAPRWPVEVVGPRFGPELWRPSRDGDVAHRVVPAGRYPGFLADSRRVADLADGDLLVAVKPRPSSFGVALLAQRRRPRPLLLDIDDWELGFFYRAGFWGRVGRALNLGDPNGLTGTWLAERRVGRADALTVASRFLEARFGGTLVPHVRDTEAWSPERFPREEARRRLGLNGEKVVMFLGTPRAHKGVDDLVAAVATLTPPVRLVLVGTPPTSPAGRRWAARPFVTALGEIAFGDVPRYLAAADAVAVPQRDTADTLGQVPAKLFDAMALARPIVSTTVSMIPEILDGCGVLVPPGDVAALAAALRRVLDRPDEAGALGRRARERCEARFSFRSARAVLFPLVERLLGTADR